MLIGLAVSLGSVACQRAISWLTVLVTGHPDYGFGGSDHAAYWLLLAPVLAGALYGPLSCWLAPGARGLAIPDMLAALDRDDGRIEARVGMTRMLTSTLCIGAGGSVGREGPTVFFGAALGSTLARITGMSATELRLAVGSGAAAATAATFDAPLTGVVLALELIVRRLSVFSCAVLGLASITALGVRRSLIGPFTLGPVSGTGSVGLLAAATICVLGALTGYALTGLLYGAQRLADRAWRGPEWLRPAVGGLLLGPLLLAAPELYGTGYPAITEAFRGGYPLGVLAVLLAGKLLATSLTLAIGGSGGIFGPAMFIGAMLGASYGSLTGEEVGGCALIGAVAVLAGATRIPVTAVFLLVEVTGDQRLLLPLTLVAVGAAALGRLLSPDTIFTAKLREHRPALPTVDLDPGSSSA